MKEDLFMKKEMMKTMTGIMTAAMLVPTFAGISASAAKDVAINKKNFPDKGFRAYVTKKDTNHDKKLSSKEAGQVKSMWVTKGTFKNLKGISVFYNLESVHIERSDLIKADFGKLKKLKKIELNENLLTSVNISKCPNLESVTITKNRLKNIDVSKNKKLKLLNVNGNFLTKLDVSKNKKLETLRVGSNNLENLDVSNNPVLNKLFASRNILTSVKMNGNKKLAELDLSVNNLTTFDLSGAPNLVELDLGFNMLKSIDLSKAPKIKNLSIEENELVEIDTTVLNNINKYSVYAGAQRAYAPADANGQYNLSNYPVTHLESLKLGYTFRNVESNILEYSIPFGSTQRENVEHFTFRDGNNAETTGYFVNTTPITWKKAQGGKKEAVLEWSEIPGATTYEVTRYDLANMERKVFGNNPDTSFTDTSVRKGCTYLYVVTSDFDGTMGNAASRSTIVAVNVK